MFDLHSLGWHSFQQLCLSIARESLGQTVASFLDSKDGGRDGAFTGVWKQAGTESLAGQYVIQCKFTGKANRSLTLSDIKSELVKVRRLVEQGRCDSYVLMTNAGVSGDIDLKIKRHLEEVGVKQSLILGGSWIDQQIRESKRLRMMVPRVYGLGDLSQILDGRAYDQAKAVLESLREDLAKVVITSSYRRSARALDEHGFVLLIGEPAAGKTTIASMLAMASADQWGASVLKLDTPAAVVQHWNPHEKSQFFWIDDAFGVTQYESGLVVGWNHILPQVKTMLKQGCRIVMTSRDYIYNRARDELKTSSFPILKESQVVIDVHDINLEERQQILYNHLKLGSQTKEFLRSIKPFLEETVASHSRFIPEIARRLANPLFTKNLLPTQWSVEQFVARREELLFDVCTSLDADSRAALALIYMRNGHLASPITLSAEEESALARLNSNLGGCTTALHALRDSLVANSLIDGEFIWTFRHPTIGDAYAAVLRKDPELLGIYVRGTDTEKLMAQVTCGDVGIQGAVILPRSLYPLVIGKLQAYKSSASFKLSWMSAWGAKDSLLRFLARRSAKDFLTVLLPHFPELLEKIGKPGLYLDFSAEVALATRLFELALLPETVRKDFVATVSEYAVDGDDGSVFSDKRIRAVLTTDELEELRKKIKRDLVPRLSAVRHNVELNHKSEDDPQEHMQYFMSVLAAVESEFPDSEEIQKSVAVQRSRVTDWVGEQDHEPRASRSRRLKIGDSDAPRGSTRSIFDDVDE